MIARPDPDLSDLARRRGYSIRTEQAYESWVCRYLAWHGNGDLNFLGPSAIKSFLEDLAVQPKVAASTQNLALNALVFFYDQVLKSPVDEFGEFVRAKRPRRLPVVLTREEIQDVLNHLEGVTRLMAELLYGTGMRLMECIRLRVLDVDFNYSQIMVRHAKGKPVYSTRFNTSSGNK